MAIEMNRYGTNGALVYQDSAYPYRVYGAVGEGARSWALRPGLPCDDTTLRPDEWINTLAGTSPITRGVAAGYPLLITTGATDYNGVNMQLAGETATLAAGKQTWLRGKIKLSVDLLSDLLFGLCELKTDLLNTSASHAVTATSVAGVFFHHAAHVSDKTLYVKVYVSGALVSSVAVGTLGTDDIDYGLWWDGTNIHAYLNGVEVAVFAGSLPAGELTPSINVRTGAAAAVTASVAELGFVHIE
jgi:hypothetical protein